MTMCLVQPVLAFNVLNANSELKRLNEVLFKELLANYGEKLFSAFDDKCADNIRILLGIATSSSHPEGKEMVPCGNMVVQQQPI